MKAVIKQVAADDADSDDDDSDDEDSEDVDTSFNQVTSPSSLVNKFSPTILTRLSEEDEDPATDDDKENRSDTKEQPNEQSYTPLSISNEEQSYAPLSIPNKSVADFFDKNPTNQPNTTEAQEQVRKQYV